MNLRDKIKSEIQRMKISQVSISHGSYDSECCDGTSPELNKAVIEYLQSLLDSTD